MKILKQVCQFYDQTMPKTGELARALRRKRIISYIAAGKNYEQIAAIENVKMQTVELDVAEIRNEMKEKYNEVIKQGTLETLALVDENAKDVIKKAYEIYDNTMDERTKLMVLKVILEAADLKKRNVIEGYNYVKIKDTNELLENTMELAKKNVPGEITEESAPKSLMPPIIVNEKPIIGATIHVDSDSVEPKVVETPENEPAEENMTQAAKLAQELQVNRHVRTNLFQKMEEDQIN